ncbi:MAG: hypothetical protein IPP51_16615 [Bacteroidetes bacterium]|nr:hypothetical protein [Bacteroidota bacterium]
MKIRLLLLLFVLSVSTAIAQKTVTTSNADSTLTIKADNRFEELVDKQKKAKSGESYHGGLSHPDLFRRESSEGD